MEIELANSNSDSNTLSLDVERKVEEEKERLRVRRKSLEAVLELCRRTLESLDDDDNDDGDAKSEEEPSREGSSTQRIDREADELCDLLKSRVECPDFLKKLECAQMSVLPNNIEEGSSWDMVSHNDLWENGNIDLDQEDYVLVMEEDIVDGVACFMAAYLLSLKQTKNLTPNQLQEALSKTFSVKKRKGKLPGGQLLLGYIKILLFLGLPPKSSGLLAT